MWARIKGTLLHATQPYDLNLYGRLRNPLYALIYGISLFPLYGVDSIFVISLWLCTNKFDEDQLTSFVIRSKSLGFVTTGLLSGVYAFTKLYLCITSHPDREGDACSSSAPGTTNAHSARGVVERRTCEFHASKGSSLSCSSAIV